MQKDGAVQRNSRTADRRLMLRAILGCGLPSWLAACKPQAQVETKPAESAPAWITLSSAIEFLFQVAVLSIPVGRYLSLSYSVAKSSLTLDTKLPMGQGNLTFKLPLSGSQAEDPRDQIIRTLQEKLDSANRNARIQDDGTLLLVLRTGEECQIIPIAEGSDPVCISTVGAHVTEIRNQRRHRVIEIASLGQYSRIYLGSCTLLRSFGMVHFSVNPESDRGLRAVLEVRDEESGTWQPIGSGMKAELLRRHENLRLRLIESNEVVWDALYEDTDFPPRCRTYRIRATVMNEPALTSAVPECDE